VYGPDGRFDRLAPVESVVERGKTSRGSGSVGNLKATEKQLGAVTDWKLLGSSVRSPTFTNVSTHKLGLHRLFFAPTEESTNLAGKPQPHDRSKTSASNPLVEGAKW